MANGLEHLKKTKKLHLNLQLMTSSGGITLIALVTTIIELLGNEVKK